MRLLMKRDNTEIGKDKFTRAIISVGMHQIRQSSMNLGVCRVQSPISDIGQAQLGSKLVFPRLSKNIIDQHQLMAILRAYTSSTAKLIIDSTINRANKVPKAM